MSMSLPAFFPSLRGEEFAEACRLFVGRLKSSEDAQAWAHVSLEVANVRAVRSGRFGKRRTYHEQGVEHVTITRELPDSESNLSGTNIVTEDQRKDDQEECGESEDDDAVPCATPGLRL